MGGSRSRSAQFKVSPVVMNSSISLLIFEIAAFLIRRLNAAHAKNPFRASAGC
jgi:hypothetical protein